MSFDGYRSGGWLSRFARDHAPLQLALTLLAAALGAFGAGYFKRRGENLATKADFDELQRQIAANTRLVESIKSEVGQKDWARREWTNLQRSKLSALLDQMHDCHAYLEKQALKAVRGEYVSEPSPRSELADIGALFPKLKPQLDAFLAAYDKQTAAALNLGKQAVIGRGVAPRSQGPQ